jgi:hypothetical protein
MTLRRIKRGGGHSYLLDGEPVLGVTTILSEGFPMPALKGWAANETAKYAAGHRDELAGLTEVEVYERLRRVHWEIRDAAGHRGREVHDLAERYIRGEEIEVPEPLTGIVDAYVRFVEEWEPRELLLETPVAYRRYPYAGTLDLVADLADGNRWLLDFKTGAKEPRRASYALQLCGYRYADLYLDEEGAEQPMVEVDRTACLWLRADGYDLFPVETPPSMHRTFLYAREVAEFRRANDPTGPSPLYGDMLAPPLRAVS